jgi:enoyl-CoA hydratase/carnithine racemase
VRAFGRQWPDNATYHGGFFDKAMALCETMSKPFIAAISGTALGLLPGAGGTQRLPRTIGPAAALMHILMGQPLNPRDAQRKGLVHETVSGKPLERAMEIAKRFCSHTPESLAYIKRLVRNATDTPLAEGLTLERISS